MALDLKPGIQAKSRKVSATTSAWGVGLGQPFLALFCREENLTESIILALSVVCKWP